MTTISLRFAGAYTPPPAHSVQLRFGGGSGPGGQVEIGASLVSAWRGAGRMQPTGAVPILAPWGRVAAAQSAAHRAPWGSSAALHGAGCVCPWSITDAVAMALVAPWLSALPRAAAWVRDQWSAPVALWASVGASAGAGPRAGGSVAAPWSYGAAVTSYGGPLDSDPPLPPPPPPCYTPPDAWFVPLRFRDALDARLPARIRFRCSGGSGVRSVPILEVYIVMNDAYLTRVSDSADVPCTGFSLSLDVGSWAWAFSATIHGAAQSLVEPVSGEPVELLVHVNGEQIRVIVESIARERTFGRSSVRIAGRGRTAWLDAPYAPISVWGNAGEARTAQQLLDSVLPYGWTATWGLTAWLVPAGVWSHQGTPISAAQAIVGAAGGYLQPHPTGQVLRALLRYPVKGWEWAGVTPDIDLPADVVQREGVEWVDRPKYNRVYVSGQAGGILGRVTLTGSAGDVVAPMITDPLITHADAARQRGIAVLSDTGRQAIETLRLPVLPATGFIVPGLWVRYADGATTRIGLARSVSIDVRFPEVWQTITVETHE